MNNKKELTSLQIQGKLAKYCAYQDRCEFEVREKAKTFNISYNEIDELVDFLTDERYLDEERFTQNFVNGKFKLKKWGKQKIKVHLRQKRIADSLIEEHLNNINYSDYLDTISDLSQKKKTSLKETDPFLVNQKTVLFLQQKGFDLEDIFKVLKNERPE